MLGRTTACRRTFARLGAEAADALDELLALALDYDDQTRRRCKASWTGCRAGEREIKRDMEHGRDEVRVMTVHGAKGLEAPIVILADTTTPPAGPPGPAALLAVPQVRAAPGTPPCIVWPGRKQDDVAAVAAARMLARQEAENEHRRLLYVAMTRAAERLVVCGCQGVNKRPEGCWYDLVTDGLAASPDFEEAGEGDAWIGRYRTVPHQDDIPGEQPRARAAPHDIPPCSPCRLRPSPRAR